MLDTVFLKLLLVLIKVVKNVLQINHCYVKLVLKAIKEIYMEYVQKLMIYRLNAFNHHVKHVHKA